MNHLSLLAQEAAGSSHIDWYQLVNSRPFLPLVLGGLVIIGITVCAVSKAWFKHRERIAKIEQGIDPDARADK